MKRSVMIAGICLLVLTAACQSAQDAPREPAQTSIPAQIVAARPNTTAPDTQSATPTPSNSPSPALDAPWYRERNEQLRTLIHQYDSARTEEEITNAIARMEIDPDKPMVALTFDDGPRVGVTDKILDVLEEYNARATFFVLGWRLNREANQQMLRRAAALGCEIGNHSFSHNKLDGQNFVSVRYEINNTNDAIEDVIGVEPHCFRPPGGIYTYESLAVTRDDGMVVVLWSQSGNVHESDPKKIAQNVEKQIVDGDELEDGDIILLHDTPMVMVDAVKIIVPALQAKGYQLVTVWELLNCSGKTLEPGAIYDRQ